MGIGFSDLFNDGPTLRFQVVNQRPPHLLGRGATADLGPSAEQFDELVVHETGLEKF